MAVTLTAKMNLVLQAYLQNSVGLAIVNGNIEKQQLTALASGTGANQVDKCFSESAKSISGNYDVDLAGGAITDIFGVVVTFARVKAIAVFADSGNSGQVIVGNGATPFFGPFGAAAHTVNIRAGGAWIAFAPDATAWPVGAGASDILRFAPSAGTQIFDWVILGASV